MSNPSRRSPQLRKLARPIIATGLIAGGLFNLALPALALTAAGTPIRNTATATYQDPNNPTDPPISTTSNTVTVTVAEVAGISVTAAGTIDNTTTNAAVLPGDELLFDFRVANIGNDPTTFFLSGQPTVSANATLVRVEITGYTNAAGVFTPLGTPIEIPAVGAVTGNDGTNTNSDTTNTVSGLPAGFGTLPSPLPNIDTLPPGVIPAGASLTVRTVVTVNATASSGSPITVAYGNTPTIGDDNVPLTVGSASGSQDVRTVDAIDGADGSPGAVSPEREASASQFMTVGATPIALARLTKTNGNYNATSNTLDYTLNLAVDATVPSGVPADLAPADLAPTPGVQIATTADLSGIAARTVVLIADRLPTNTSLTVAPTAPSGWTTVYSIDDTGAANEVVQWTTAIPTGGLPAVRRVGFVNTSTIGTDGGLIVRGTTVGPFVFTINVSAIAANSSVYNMAQVFGRTAGTTTPVVDESGDTSPSNLLQDGTANSEPRDPDGLATPGDNGVDNAGNNSGIGPGGEANVFQVPGNVTILNGPNGNPAASGPTNNNDDFTNQSTPIPANQTAAFDPAPIIFTNTISNPTGSPLTNVLLVPDVYDYTAVAPTTSPTTGLPVAGRSLPPNGTTVTLTFNGISATYTFNGTNFIYTSGTAIQIPSLAAGQTVNYTATVNLPSSALSTTTGLGYDIPIWAFQDVNGDSRPDAGDTVANRTFNRAYVGYLRLFKQARIFDINGTTVLSTPAATGNAANAEGWFSDLDPTQATAVQTLVQPDRFIQYRVTYENVSTSVGGVGSLALNASSVVITENGTTGTNNWATELNGLILTSHDLNSATATFGTITYNNGGQRTGNTQATDVVEYINNVNTLIQPLGTGNFTFRRQFN